MWTTSAVCQESKALKHFLNMSSQIQTQKGSNKRLFILTRTHSMQIFGEISFIKPQNDTWTTDKRLKTMKNEREKLVLVEFLSLNCKVLLNWRCLLIN